MTMDLKTALVSYNPRWASLGASCQEKTSWEVNIPVPRPEYKPLVKRLLKWTLDSHVVKPTIKKYIRLLCSESSDGFFCSASLRNGMPAISLDIHQVHTMLSSSKEMNIGDTKIKPWHHEYTKRHSNSHKESLKPPFFRLAKDFDEFKNVYLKEKDITWRKTSHSDCHLPIPASYDTGGHLDIHLERVIDNRGNRLKNLQKVTVNEDVDHPFTFTNHVVSKNAIDVTETDNHDITEDFLTKIGMLCKAQKRDGLTRRVCATSEWALNKTWAPKWKIIYWRKRYQIPAWIAVALLTTSATLGLYISNTGTHH